MSTRSGKTTQRTKVDSYKGFSIIKVKVIEYWKPSYNQSYTNIPDKTYIHYDFCKEGNETRPSQAYECNAKHLNDCKACIDSFIEDDTLYFTSEEREKYVYKPNRKCDWAYGYNSLMKIMHEHQKADKRMKVLLEDRLVDANFHSEAGYLSTSNYKAFEELVSNTYQFREKFEVITSSMCKRIKNPKQFEEGLAKVVEEYLISQGVKKTSVKVNFIENW